MERVIELRGSIRRLQAEATSIKSQKRSREQVKALLDNWLDAAAAQGLASLELAVDCALVGQAFAPLNTHGNAAVIQSPGAAPFSLDLGPLLVAVLGKAAIRKSLQPLVEKSPDGLDPAGKASRLAAIEFELFQLETEEEALIVELELAGEPILRRPDARPEIILA